MHSSWDYCLDPEVPRLTGNPTAAVITAESQIVFIAMTQLAQMVALAFMLSRNRLCTHLFCQRAVQKLAHMATQQLLLTAVGRLRFWRRGITTCRCQECLLLTWLKMQATLTCMCHWRPAIWPHAGVKLLLMPRLQISTLSSCHC